MSMNRRKFRACAGRVLVPALFCCATSVAAAQRSAGHWEGTMRRGRSTLPVTVDLTGADTVRGAFTAGDLGAMNVPLTNLRVGRATHWELVGDHSTVVFDGVQRGDTIIGSFTESGTAGTFQLRRLSFSTEPPYTSTEVHFTNGGVTLAGTVLSPKGPGLHPAVVFLHGSGAEGRWANAYVADYLARHGVVALIYDKRGVGASSGDWKTGTLEDLAADGRAAVDLLAARADVDARRLGVFGHSQGGFIAPMVAADPRVRWIVDADGNVGPQYEQDLFRVGTAFAKRWHGDTLRDAMALYHEFIDVARNGLPHAPFRADAARHRSAPWFDALALPDDSDWVWSWYARAGNTDNRASWARVSVPVLLLYGGDDDVVPTRSSIDVISRLLARHGNRAITVRVLPGADHTLRLPPADRTGWPRYAPGYPKLLADWIARTPGLF